MLTLDPISVNYLFVTYSDTLWLIPQKGKTFAEEKLLLYQIVISD